MRLKALIGLLSVEMITSLSHDAVNAVV